ncbi:MAG: ABC transporter permease, partial [Pseudomonadota bacterium]|nr:ABC transporter permease [Pseudomonadota bacterium]
MMNAIAALGRTGLDLLASLGRASQFLGATLVATFAGLMPGGGRFSVGLGLLIRQFYVVGVLSLAIIVVSGLFIGMVLGLQGYTIL